MALFDQDQLKIMYYCPNCNKMIPLMMSTSPKCPECNGDVIATKYNYSVWKTLNDDAKTEAVNESKEKITKKEEKKKLDIQMAENSMNFIITTADLK